MQIKRWRQNPVIEVSSEFPWMGHQARNPGVIWDGGKLRMIFTAGSRPTEHTPMYLSLGYAESVDGYNFTIRERPWMDLEHDTLPFDRGSLEDVRITELDGQVYLAYAGRAMHNHNFWNTIQTAHDPKGNPVWTQNFRRVGLAVPSDKDWTAAKRLGPITSEQMSDANVVLFPEKFGGKYCMLHRPTPFPAGQFQGYYYPGAIFIAFSDDILDWKWGADKAHEHWPVRKQFMPDDHVLIRPEFDWERLKIGGSGVPIPTDDGWLVIYHAVDMEGMYRVGLLLLDRDDPKKVVARSPVPIMEPEDNGHDMVGTYKQGPGCIFPCANPLVGDEVFIYYGAMDQRCCLATVQLKELLDYALTCRR
ncbi:MAG: hypothetical protein K9M45_02825 [Kiritimatiellales bacterium]|nr:hypothetical protein [Kiritimatiellales bacterium]